MIDGEATTLREGSIGRESAALARALGRWRALGEIFAAERERWVLWLPAFLGAGIGLYFALPVEPPVWLGGLFAVPAVLAAILGRRHTGVLLVALVLAALSLGFTVAAWRTASISAPILAKRLGPAMVHGRVVEVGVREVGVRLVIEHPEIAGLAPEVTPGRVRVTVRAAGETVRPGDWVRLRAVLMPPPPPAAPGAFDFARKAYFRGLGAVGYAVSRAAVLEAPVGEGPGGFATWLSRLRQDISARVGDGLDGAAGAVARALMTGKRRAG